MIHEKIGEERGKVTNIRVLPSDPASPQIEVSFEATGELLGIDITGFGSYVAIPGPDGVLDGEGQGVVMTADGHMLTWTGQGRGKRTGKGHQATWRGTVYYHTDSPRLKHLNEIACAFQHDVNEKGETHSQLFELK